MATNNPSAQQAFLNQLKKGRLTQSQAEAGQRYADNSMPGYNFDPKAGYYKGTKPSSSPSSAQRSAQRSAKSAATGNSTTKGGAAGLAGALGQYDTLEEKALMAKMMFNSGALTDAEKGQLGLQEIGFPTKDNLPSGGVFDMVAEGRDPSKQYYSDGTYAGQVLSTKVPSQAMGGQTSITSGLEGPQMDSPFNTGNFDKRQESTVGYRANGGPVEAGQPYIVGERGPELIYPSQDGNVLSNEMLQLANQSGIDPSGLSEEELRRLLAQQSAALPAIQTPATPGVATEDNAGAPITNASQLRAFMSGLNEQALASGLVAETPPPAPAVEPEVMGTPESFAGPSVDGKNVITPEAPQVQAPQGLTTAGGQTLAEFLAGGQQKDAQGRMIDPNVDRSSFEQASADREARQAARLDFGTAVSDRDRRAARGDGISDADRSDIAKANRQGASASDIARGAKVAALNGVDRRTGNPLKKDGALTDYQKASLALRERELGNTGKKQTATEEKISTLKSANPNLSDADASAIASGSVKVVQNPLTGETQLLNIATGESRKVGADQDTSVNFDVAIPEKTLYGRIGKFTGAVEGTKRKLQALGGQVGVNVATDESLEASQDFKAAQNQLVRAFKQSDRYSATESKQLKEELGIDLSLFEDPKTAEAKLRSADQTLARNYENEIATFQDTSFPPEARQDARLRAKAIAEFRALIGVPEEGAKPVEVKFDPRSLTERNQQAYAWATSNPSDPRSQAILAKLNSQ